MRLLIDECLSPGLAKHARHRGFESSHVVWLKRGGWKDWSLKTLIVDGDWTFVTRNSVDFRGPEEAPGTRASTPMSRCTLVLSVSTVRSV